jgi:hypothetical protein
MNNKESLPGELDNPGMIQSLVILLWIPSSLDDDALLKRGGEYHNSSVQEDKMSTENGRVGFLFSSKAFVQLIANPAVGYATQKLGYHLPFISGSATLLLSAISKLHIRSNNVRIKS